jgi:hypothetical protein
MPVPESAPQEVRKKTKENTDTTLWTKVDFTTQSYTPRKVLVIPYLLIRNLSRYTNRASGPLTAVKHVRDSVSF